MQPSLNIRLGTRKSKLAIAQAELVKAAILNVAPEYTIEIVSMLTSGDKAVDHPLSEIGGKGLFTKELEEQLCSGSLDIAVHSLKDMPTILPQGLFITCVLRREDARDALLASAASSLKTLPKNPVIGTSSLRRAALVKIMRPDSVVVPFRGNVPTRIEKVRRNEVDASLLAQAGLIRLGLENESAAVLDPEFFTPAVGQGAICIECRTQDAVIIELLSKIHHKPTYDAITAERAMLAILDGSCRTPIGGYAIIKNSILHLNAFVAMPDGSRIWRTSRSGSPSDALRMGQDAGRELRLNAKDEVFCND